MWDGIIETLHQSKLEDTEKLKSCHQAQCLSFTLKLMELNLDDITHQYIEHKSNVEK